jgi:plastocyanin
MKRFGIALPAALALVAATCSQQPLSSPTQMQGGSPTAGSAGANTGERITTQAKTPLTATVQFGIDAGSPFPPQEEHDQSGHAADNLVPRTVVIGTGGTVTFNTFGVHQVTIYDDGTQPEDIDTSLLAATPCVGPGAPLLIDDPENRLAIFDQPCAGGPPSPSYTFTEPGRYLVICAFLPHFEVQMWGWVIVKD